MLGPIYMEVWDPKKVKSPEAGHPTYHVLKCDQILKMRDYMDRRVFPPKGRTIRKLMGGAGEVQKKNSRKGKLNEKKFLQAN